MPPAPMNPILIGSLTRCLLCEGIAGATIVTNVPGVKCQRVIQVPWQGDQGRGIRRGASPFVVDRHYSTGRVVRDMPCTGDSRSGWSLCCRCRGAWRAPSAQITSCAWWSHAMRPNIAGVGGIGGVNGGVGQQADGFEVGGGEVFFGMLQVGRQGLAAALQAFVNQDGGGAQGAALGVCLGKPAEDELRGTFGEFVGDDARGSKKQVGLGKKISHGKMNFGGRVFKKERIFN